jgi:hypothetical protein
MERLAGDGGIFFVHRVGGGARLAQLEEIRADDVVRDHLQPDLGMLRGHPAHSADYSDDPCVLIVAADRHERVQREFRRDAQRGMQAEARGADVLHLPRPARRRVHGTLPVFRQLAGPRLDPIATEDRELHRGAETAAGLDRPGSGRIVPAQKSGDGGEADDGVDGAACVLALPAAGKRLELRVDPVRDLDQELELLPVR